jgi:hypothetical protein
MAWFSEDQLLYRHRVGDGGMVKFIYFESAEVTQGDGWFEMHKEIENYPDGAFKVNIETDEEHRSSILSRMGKKRDALSGS